MVLQFDHTNPSMTRGKSMLYGSKCSVTTGPSPTKPFTIPPSPTQHINRGITSLLKLSMTSWALLEPRGPVFEACFQYEVNSCSFWWPLLIKSRASGEHYLIVRSPRSSSEG